MIRERLARIADRVTRFATVGPTPEQLRREYENTLTYKLREDPHGYRSWFIAVCENNGMSHEEAVAKVDRGLRRAGAYEPHPEWYRHG